MEIYTLFKPVCQIHTKLNKIFTVMRLVCLFIIVACFQASANGVAYKKSIQQRGGSINLNVSIKGRVLDEQNKPMPGVSVRLKGTITSTATNSRGEYSLSVPVANGKLIFSFIGYQTVEVDINGQTNIDVHLKPSNRELQEMVVVGYGTQKKADLTGAVDQITGKDLENRPVANVSTALQGLMANLNITTNYGGGAPGATKSINVRGFTDLSGSLGGPLILVDGVETDINSINANDIESISLLKDAASSSLYGSRAPNGVLLITTKQGKKNQSAQLSYSNNFSAGQPLNVPTMSNSLVWANTYNEAAENAGIGQFIPDVAIARIQSYLQNPQGTPTTVATPNSTTWASYDPIFANANNDWFKIYLKKWAYSQQHNLSLSGGSDKITYYVAGGTSQNAGLYNYFSDSYVRDNFRANLTADVNKYITVSIKTAFNQQNTSAPNPGTSQTGGNWFHQIARIWPIIPLYDPNGGSDFYSEVSLNTNGGRNRQKDNQSRISGDVIIKPLPGLNLTAHYNYDNENYNQLYSTLPYYYSTVTNPQTLSNTISSVSENYALTTYYDYNFFASYEKQLHGHYFKVQIGQETEQKTYSNLNGYNQYLYSTQLPSLNLTSGIAPQTTDAGGYSWATTRTMGRLNYNYKEKYLVEGNANYMGTSLFPQNSRYAWFTSVSAGWNVSKENFFQPLQKYINNLKFRASYGGLGDITSFLNNQNYYPYIANLGVGAASNSQWIFSPGSGGRLPYVNPPGSLISPTLTWSRPSKLDVGVDVDFLNDFNITADWYRANITEQFGPSSTYPAVLGINPPTVNNAASVTKGWDLTASWRHQFGKFGVNMRGNISHYAGVVTKYDGNPLKLLNGRPYVGQPIGAIWGYKTVGKFQSTQQITNAPNQSALYGGTWYPGDIQYADLNHDGKITVGDNTVNNPGDQAIIGNRTPKYFYGLTTNLNWKGLDLFVFIQGQGHADFMPGSNYFWGITSMYQSTVTPKLADRWSASNPNGYFPRIDFNNGWKDQYTQTGYLLNTAYMRLKNLQLGYTFPDRLTAPAHVYHLHLYSSIENLATISGAFKHQYVDPELLQSDEKIYPLQRTFSLGLQMNIK
jgi:TonB-linked SusC/RagA family outer membrane protein